MPVIEIEWSPEFAVGVDVIDLAHQELFRITARLAALGEDKNRHQWVGEQGLKFLKSYVNHHFFEEEAYMRSIHYPGIQAHTEQHLAMRDHILPRMERQLRHEKYSEESIKKFLTIIQLWLTRHIMVHDVAFALK